MDAVNLFDSERTLMSSEDGSLTLTSERVRYREGGGGTTRIVSMRLSSVSACAITTTGHPALLALAAVLLLVALAARKDEAQLLAGLFAVGLAALYWFTRRGAIEIQSCGGMSIVAPTAGMSADAQLRFVDALEAACRKDPRTK